MAPAAGGKVVCLVTGGAGFLGKNLVHQLVQSGAYDVTIFDIRDAQIAGVKTIVGDLRDLEQVAAAVKGKLNFQGCLRWVVRFDPTAGGHVLVLGESLTLIYSSVSLCRAILFWSLQDFHMGIVGAPGGLDKV
jgi:NAD(P)-dependent dehydrogenase (short-subunit alcohol dehydrogenase family)